MTCQYKVPTKVGVVKDSKEFFPPKQKILDETLLCWLPLFSDPTDKGIYRNVAEFPNNSNSSIGGKNSLRALKVPPIPNKNFDKHLVNI